MEPSFLTSFSPRLQPWKPSGLSTSTYRNRGPTVCLERVLWHEFTLGSCLVQLQWGSAVLPWDSGPMREDELVEHFHEGCRCN